MKQYLDINDIANISETIQEAIELKKNPYQFKELGSNKTLVMLFFNSSLRTRLSTEKAAKNLGMDVMVLNVSNTWDLEFEDGTIMDLDKAEHIKEAAKVISEYADVIAVRAFPTMTDKEKDESEMVLNSFQKYATVPVVNMESSTAHPLQALTDALTIEELKKANKSKVVLSWAPHPKVLPHAVANSFVTMMKELDVDLTITHPVGYDLNPEIVGGVEVNYNQEEAFKDADFVYVKNWSSYQDYGKVLPPDSDWTITQEKLGNAKFMHCLPVRRITDTDTLDIITMVYAGKISKNIVAKLQSYGCNAVGFSGADGNTVIAEKRPVKEIDYGFVGDIVEVDTKVLKLLLSNNVTVCFCAISHDQNGQLFNTNADTIASELSIALSKDFDVELYYSFEKNGVLTNVEDPNSVVEKIDQSYYQQLKEQGVIFEGMIPKLDNCFYAIENGVTNIHLGTPEMIFDSQTKHTIISQ